jgi:hypothetical protein
MTEDDIRKRCRELEVINQQSDRRRFDAMEMLKASLLTAADRFSDCAAVLEEDGYVGSTPSFLRASAQRYRTDVEIAERLWRGDIK